MRWLTFAICAVVVVTLQVTIAPRVECFGVRPDWILVLAVFFALNGRNADVLIGAWILGAVADLFTRERFGLLSLSYGLAALLVYGVREYLFREHPFTHFCVTFISCLAIQFTLAAYKVGTLSSIADWPNTMTREPLLMSLFTALYAMPVHYVLLRFHRLLGIKPARFRRHRLWIGKGRSLTPR